MMRPVRGSILMVGWGDECSVCTDDTELVLLVWLIPRAAADTIGVGGEPAISLPNWAKCPRGVVAMWGRPAKDWVIMAGSDEDWW